MVALSKQNIDFKKYINYMLIAYAFSFPISKAAANFFEILLLLTWIYEGNWKEKWQQYRHNFVSLALILFLLYSFISILWAQETSFAISYVLKYRHFLIILIFYTYLEQKYIEKILSAFLLAMFVSEIMSYGIFFEFWHYKHLLPTDPTPFMDHISYSVFLAITGAILFARIIYIKENKIYTIAYALFFATLTINLFINAGRTGQVIYLLSLMIITIFLFQNKIKAFITSLVLITFITLTAYSFSPNFQARVSALSLDIHNAYNMDFRGSMGTRISLWILGVEQIVDTMPIIGDGIGNDMNKIFYYLNKNHHINEEFFNLQGDHHNMFITITIIYGFIGLFLIIFLFYSIIKLNFKSSLYKSLNLSFIIGYTLWSMTGNNFHGMNPMTFFAFFAGFFNAVSRIENNIKINS